MNNLTSSGMNWAMWVAVFIYAFFILFFVVRGALRTKNMTDYAVGTISFSPIAVGLSMAASMTSAATFIINPGFVAYYGLSGFLSMAVFLPIGALVSLVILSKRFRKYGNVVKAKTISQWMGNRYQSKPFSLYFAFLSLLLITFIVLICVGLTQVLSKSLNVEPLYVLIGVVVFTFGYMMFGGANSMVYTNMIQAILMLIVAIILLTSGFEHFSNGVQGFLDKLAAIDPQLAQPFNTGSPLFRDYFEVIICQLIVGVAIVCQPHIITRSLLLKNDKQVNMYLATGIIVQTVFFFVVFTGLYTRLFFPALQNNGVAIPLDAVMSSYVVAHFPVYVSILLVIGMISAGISTLEGLIQSLSTTITSDIIKPITGSSIIKDEQRGFISELALNRIVIIILGAVAFKLSYNQLVEPDLSVGIFAQNGVYAYFSAAFVPVLFGIFLKNVPTISVVAGSLTAVIVHFSIYYGRLTPYMQEGTRNPGIASAIAIVSSLIVALSIYLLKRKNKHEEMVVHMDAATVQA